MSNRRRENLQRLAADWFVGVPGVFVLVFVLVGVAPGVARVFGVVVGILVLVLVVGALVLGVLGGLVGLVVKAWGRRRGSQAPAGLRTVLRPTPRTLRWVRGLLPGDEGAAWLVEVSSCLAEAQDKGERRRYVRSYRRNVPQLIWTSWTVHLRASRRRELS